LAETEVPLEHYRAIIPAGAALMPCGLDAQADRFELDLVGWGLGEHSWSLECRTVAGNPSGADLDGGLRTALTGLRATQAGQQQCAA
jgi:phage terminase large subunit GpA-like protein